MKLFMPDRVIFEPSSLEYPLGKSLYNFFSSKNIETFKTSIQNVSRVINSSNEKEKYAQSKKTLVITTKKSLRFDTCKPSADYEFSLVTNCPGSCEYCYLQTTQGYKPYLKIYVNIEEIFESIKKHIEKNNNEITTFEAASSGDPLAFEHLTGSLSKTIEFFSGLENGRLRVVTKFENVEPFLDLKHNGHTKFRLSMNSKYVINNFEHNTAGFEDRISAASKLAAANYPLGFIIAPIIIYKDWEKEYEELFKAMKEKISTGDYNKVITFELIQHRFTPIAKNFILQRFPNTKLDMDESKRILKWGKYGRFKYVYPKETAAEIKNHISSLIIESFPDAKIEYFT